jgi:flagellar basal-body rod modification protein FlgD
MTGSNPIVGQTPPSSSSSNSNPAPSNQLTANSFITLLTTQLQAQDPLNPLDPNQMVNELTTMNSFEQLLQIRQDLDALVSAAQASGSGGGSGSGTGGNAPTGALVPNLASANSVASAPQISALSNALVAKSLAAMPSQLNSKSPLF